MPLVREAMEIWVREMPDIYLSLLIIRYPMNTSRWVGWPTEDSPYGFPHSWQWEFLKTLLRLRPADAGEAEISSGSRGEAWITAAAPVP